MLYHSSASGIHTALDVEVPQYQGYSSTHCLLHVRAVLVADLYHFPLCLHKEGWPQNEAWDFIVNVMVLSDQHPFPSSPLVKNLHLKKE